MKCPSCKTVLCKGKVAIARPTVGLIADVLLSTGSLSPHYLYFYPHGDEDNPLCIDALDSAFHCSQCGLLLLCGQDDAEDLACMSCGKVIPPNQTKCPACGWSWEDAKEE